MSPKIRPPCPAIQNRHSDPIRPCVTVSLIVRQIAYGASMDEVLADYPDLARADVEQALQYAAWLSSERIFAG